MRDSDEDVSSADEFSDDDDDETGDEDASIEFTRRFGSRSVPDGGEEDLSTYTSTMIDAIITDFLQNRFGPTPEIRSLAGSDQTS